MDKNTFSTEKNTKSKKDRVEAVNGSLKAIEDLISRLERERETLASSRAEYDKYTKEIGKAKSALASLEIAYKGFELGVKGANTELRASLDLLESFGEDLGLKPALEKQKESVEENIESYKEYQEAVRKTQEAIESMREQTLTDALDGLSGELEKSFGISAKVINGLFDSIRDNADNSFNSIMKIATNAFASIAEIGGAMYQSRIENLELQAERSNAYYDELLENENLTESERSRLEADRDAKEEAIRQKQKSEQVKQARLEKAINIATIIANTAVAVSKACLLYTSDAADE